MHSTISRMVLVLFLGGTIGVMPGISPILVIDRGDSYNLTGWRQYHNYAQIVALLQTLNRTWPDIIDLFSIGKSFLGREIYCVRLTNESDLSPKPEVFFNGYHHAREQITSELPLFFVMYTVSNYGSNVTVTGLLNECDVYVVVALNVDGFDLFEENGWQRANARGVDLNRNYDYGWAGGGEAPFSEPETQAIRDFTLAHHFKYALSFHSGIELVLYPWGCTRQAPPDQQRLVEISRGISEVTLGTTYRQSCNLYLANGTWGDWTYGVAGVPAITCEIFGPFLSGQPYSYGSDLDPAPSLGFQGEIGSMYNPRVEYLQTRLLRWLPAFFYIMNRAVSEAQGK